jgi:hypothetical protein
MIIVLMHHSNLQAVQMDCPAGMQRAKAYVVQCDIVLYICCTPAASLIVLELSVGISRSFIIININIVYTCINFQVRHSCRVEYKLKIQYKIYTGRFIMFSVITNIYNKKIKRPTLMEFFTATGKLRKFFCDK